MSILTESDLARRSGSLRERLVILLHNSAAATATAAITQGAERVELHGSAAAVLDAARRAQTACVVPASPELPEPEPEPEEQMEADGVPRAPQQAGVLRGLPPEALREMAGESGGGSGGTWAEQPQRSVLDPPPSNAAAKALLLASPPPAVAAAVPPSHRSSCWAASAISPPVCATSVSGGRSPRRLTSTASRIAIRRCFCCAQRQWRRSPRGRARSRSWRGCCSTR
eukprot:COSAG04_NODE_5368_length_1641_cov_0.991569_2_plen_227_part_00